MSSPTAATATAPVTAQDSGTMTQRQVVQALSGMLLAMFTAFLSATIVSNALPVIITDLHGSQSQYTWVVTATLLASTASTPIWGKLSDLFSKKLLVQLGIVLYIGGSVLAGFSQSVETLIAWRAVQGLGLGALQSLIIIVIAAMISPRERGRYTGPIAAVMSLATVAGPLIGGLIVDSPLGWRWCFWVGAPVAVVALIVVQRTLNLPVVKRRVKIDYLGAALIAGGVCDLLIWVTLAGDEFAWTSGTSWLLLGIGVVLLALAVFVESRAAEPIVPLYLFKNRTTTLATVASIAVGVAMFGGAVFLGQYFQIARGYSPTASGLLTLPMILASTLSATFSGILITRLGRWKAFLVVGSILMVVGFGLLGTIDHTTDMVLIGGYLAVLGLGMGMTMQNLVLAVQNTVQPSDLGAASSTVTFFRSLGGTVGVSVLGAVLASQVADRTADGLAAAGVAVPEGGAGADVSLASLNDLPPALGDIVRGAYGDGTATIFLVAGALAIISVLAIVFIKEVPLRTLSGIQQQQAESAGGAETTAEITAETVVEPVREPVWHQGRHALHESTPRAAADPDGIGPAVYGFVGTAGGAGIGSAVVTLTGPDGVQVGRAGTAADGGFEFHLPTGGTYLLVVASGALRPSATMVAVADAPVRHDVVLGGGVEVTGTVRPAVPTTLTAIDARGDVVGVARTDAGGRYRMDGLAAGTVTLTAAGEGHPPVATTVTLTDGTPLVHDVTVPDRATLRGTVTADGTGRGVPEAVATLVDPDGHVVGSTTTDADGRFGFDDLPAGRYTLTAAGYAPDVQVVRVEPGGTTDVRVALGPAGGPGYDTARRADRDTELEAELDAELDTGPVRVQPVAGD
ncbi:MFS transporter [Pseudonocardia sp. WMMC193]|uniref:MFS transporter n=1 Tax=Pseudonocardia sp. WMMC193 TaxID=2911965 RepID=UPI001F3CDDB3|nr:MFS transporter [Pseudonocardia sp. WMMC193]MCF7549875.1 MFS transporter [Pseudonocardia sp. WMMC193]